MSLAGIIGADGMSGGLMGLRAERSSRRWRASGFVRLGLVALS